MPPPIVTLFLLILKITLISKIIGADTLESLDEAEYIYPDDKKYIDEQNVMIPYNDTNLLNADFYYFVENIPDDETYSESIYNQLVEEENNDRNYTTANHYFSEKQSDSFSSDLDYILTLLENGDRDLTYNEYYTTYEDLDDLNFDDTAYILPYNGYSDDVISKPDDLFEPIPLLRDFALDLPIRNGYLPSAVLTQSGENYTGLSDYSTFEPTVKRIFRSSSLTNTTLTATNSTFNDGALGAFIASEPTWAPMIQVKLLNDTALVNVNASSMPEPIETQLFASINSTNNTLRVFIASEPTWAPTIQVKLLNDTALVNVNASSMPEPTETQLFASINSTNNTAYASANTSSKLVPSLMPSSLIISTVTNTTVKVNNDMESNSPSLQQTLAPIFIITSNSSNNESGHLAFTNESIFSSSIPTNQPSTFPTGHPSLRNVYRFPTSVPTVNNVLQPPIGIIDGTQEDKQISTGSISTVIMVSSLAICIVFIVTLGVYMRHKKRQAYKFFDKSRLNLLPYDKIGSNSKINMRDKFSVQTSHTDNSALWEEIDENIEFNTIHQHDHRSRTNDSC